MAETSRASTEFEDSAGWLVSVGGAATASRQFASLPSFNLFIHSRALSPVSLKKPAYTL